jgi:glyoxylase-like metal-dependent hydrolase (beta-lactamase superfamily II)
MEHIGTNVFVETFYPGVNLGCIITGEGTVCIDTPLLPGEAQRWRQRIDALEGEPVRFVVYTSGQRERILGTQYLIRIQQDEPSLSEALFQPDYGRDGKKDGGTQPPLGLLRHLQGGFAARIADMGSGFFASGSTVIAHKLAWAQVQEHRSDNFKQSMIDTLADRDPDIINLEVISPQITLDASLKLFVGDEVIEVLAVARGALWVWLPGQGVLFAGDTVVVGTHPPLIATDTREWLAALARLRRERRFREAIIVPGRGSVCDASATEPLTEYLRLARDRTRRIYRAGRPKADLNKVAADLLSLYPVINGQHERVQRQIKLGLDDLYDTFKAADVDDSDAVD